MTRPIGPYTPSETSTSQPKSSSLLRKLTAGFVLALLKMTGVEGGQWGTGNWMLDNRGICPPIDITRYQPYQGECSQALKEITPLTPGGNIKEAFEEGVVICTTPVICEMPEKRTTIEFVNTIHNVQTGKTSKPFSRGPKDVTREEVLQTPYNSYKA